MLANSAVNKSILAIAGFDPSGKAGIIRDVGVIMHLGLHASSVPTALTIQDFNDNFGFEPLAPPLFETMLDVLLKSRKPDGVKIGMVPNVALAAIIRNALEDLIVPIVYDPVMSSSDGAPLTTSGEEKEVFSMIVPVSSVVTPNIPEAEMFTGIDRSERNFAEKVAEKLISEGTEAVLLKGGHAQTDSVSDVLVCSDGVVHFYRRRRVKKVLRGTGCALSSALATLLANNLSIADAFLEAEKTMDKLLPKMIT